MSPCWEKDKKEIENVGQMQKTKDRMLVLSKVLGLEDVVVRNEG